MLLVYVDESNRGSQVSFAGVIATGNQVHELSLQLSEISRRAAAQHALERSPIFHAYEMFHGRGVWRNVAPRARVRIFEDVITAVGNCCTRIIFRSLDAALPCGSIREPGATAGSKAEERCLDLLLLGVNDFSHDRDLRSLVISDMRTDRESHRERLERHKDETPSLEVPSAGFAQILDTIHFAPSRRSRLLQAADVVAFVLSRAAIKERDVRSSQATARLVNILSVSGRLDSQQF